MALVCPSPCQPTGALTDSNDGSLYTIVNVMRLLGDVEDGGGEDAYLQQVDSWVCTLAGTLPSPPSSIYPFSASFIVTGRTALLCHMLLPPLQLKYTDLSSHDKNP